MDLKNKEKTEFVIDVGIFCYKIMPFDLKNVKPTYQKIVTKVFKGLISRNMEDYIDDMLVKSLLSE